MAKIECPDCGATLKQTKALWVLQPAPAGADPEWVETAARVRYCKCGFRGVEWEALAQMALAVADDEAPKEAQFPLRLPQATRDLIKGLAKKNRRQMNDLFLQFVGEGLRRTMDAEESE